MIHLHGFCMLQIEEIPVFEEVPEPEPEPVSEPIESSNNDSLETPEENQESQNDTEGSPHVFPLSRINRYSLLANVSAFIDSYVKA